MNKSGIWTPNTFWHCRHSAVCLKVLPCVQFWMRSSTGHVVASVLSSVYRTCFVVFVSQLWPARSCDCIAFLAPCSWHRSSWVQPQGARTLCLFSIALRCIILCLCCSLNPGTDFKRLDWAASRVPKAHQQLWCFSLCHQNISAVGP